MLKFFELQCRDIFSYVPYLCTKICTPNKLLRTNICLQQLIENNCQHPFGQVVKTQQLKQMLYCPLTMSVNEP